MGNQIINTLSVYVAGDNIISGLGHSTAENVENLLSYDTGVRLIDNRSYFSEPFLASEITRSSEHTHPDYTPLEQIMIESITDTLAASKGKISATDCALIISTTKGNIDACYFDDDRVYLWAMANRIAAYFGITEKPKVVSNACISGLSAIIIASRMIESGQCQHVIVAGCDVLSRFVVTGFQSFKSISTKLCRPYDKDRDGLNLGEACGSVLLTADRALAQGDEPVVIEGGTITNDANHISGPSRTGEELSMAITQTMREVGVSTQEIGFVNAHGTATLYNDEMESKAIALSGLNHIPTNSLKAYFGHTLGASGIIESILCFEQMRRGVIFGTKGFSESGVPQSLSLSSEHQWTDSYRCIKTASGFGGCNAAASFALESRAKRKNGYEKAAVKTTSSCAISNGKVFLNDELIVEESGEFGSFIRKAYKQLNDPNMKFFKMDNLCKLGYIASELILKDRDLLSQYQSEEIGLVFQNRSSSLDSDQNHYKMIGETDDLAASPSIFVYTLPNIVMGEICVRNKFKGENTFFISEQRDQKELDTYVATLISMGKIKACLTGWCELINDEYSINFELIEKQ